MWWTLLFDRYDNLDDALGSIKPVYKKVLTVSSSGAANEATVTTMIGAVEDDDLWCTHCMDDPAVAVCAFCGCRVRNDIFHHFFIFILVALRNLYWSSRP
jgi:hypothetical protein